MDALRGAVMMVMALDHVRDLVHRGAMASSPTDFAVTTPVLFLTRWITHFCAPVFLFTAGLGAFFWWRNGRSRRQLSAFLVTRGLWLIVLELTLMQLAYNFDVARTYPVFLLVLWVIGACMVVMAALVWLPLPVLAAFSVATIVLHHLADGMRATRFGAAAGVWSLLHQVGAFTLAGQIVIVGYPMVPWIGVMALGFCFGPLFLRTPDVRRRYLLGIGTAITLAFFVIRVVNGYGDQSHWAPQKTHVLTILSFLNTSKYPPSLAFLLMTLGPALIAIGLIDRLRFTRSNSLIVFGRVPLFYFVLHFYAAHAVAVILALFTYGRAALGFMFQPVPSMGGPAKAFPPQFGYDLWMTYAVWLAIVAGLYPLCRWFAAVRERHSNWWLSYL